MAKTQTFTISGTSPAAEGTAVVGTPAVGLLPYSHFLVAADLVGATGGVLDIYLQRKIADNVWRDWAHFTQLTAGGAAVKWSVHSSIYAPDRTIVAVGGGTDASPGVALAANAFVGGHPGTSVRCIGVAGASTSAGAAVLIRIIAWTDDFAG